MWWLLLWIALFILALAGLIASAGSLRFAFRVARDVRTMWGNSAPATTADTPSLVTLPGPVQRYLAKALRKRATTTAIRTARLRHRGRLRTTIDGPWQAMQGQQYEATAPPGFVRWGRVRLAPGLWIDARDRCIRGHGDLFVAFEATVPLYDRSGRELDQGSMLRLLSDLVLVPTALADPRYVTWSPVDERHARASLHLGPTRVTGLFEFGDDDLPCTFVADRYFGGAGGEPELRPWSIAYRDYGEVDGTLIPFHILGSWQVDGQPVPYVELQLERPEYDVTVPY